MRGALRRSRALLRVGILLHVTASGLAQAEQPPTAVQSPSPAQSPPAIASVPVVDEGGQSMAHLKNAWDRAVHRRGQVRVLFWGASHTAADIWSGELRRRWSAVLGESGHGFVLPVRWNLGYRAQDLVIDSSKGWQVTRWKPEDTRDVIALGHAGLVAQSADPADWAVVKTTTDNPLGRRFDQAEVWLHALPDGGDMRVDVDGKPLIIQGKGERGQPIIKHLNLADGPHEIRLQPVGNGPVALYGVVTERSQPGVMIDQLGIPGMRADILLHWKPEVLTLLTKRRHPDLVILAYGTNDVGDDNEPVDKYLETWRKVLTLVRWAAPDASCLLIGPTDRLGKDENGQKRTLPRTPTVIAAQRKVAQEFRCGHWDAQAAMGGPGGMQVWAQSGLATKDDVHLTRAGYERMAEILDNSLRAAMERATALEGPVAPVLKRGKVARKGGR